MTKSENTKLLSEIASCFSRLKVKPYVESVKPKGKVVRGNKTKAATEEKPQACPEIFNAAAIVIVSLSKRPAKVDAPQKFVVDKASTTKELIALSQVLERHADELLKALTHLNADAISALRGGLCITGLSEELIRLSQIIVKLAKKKKFAANPLERRGVKKNIGAVYVARAVAAYYKRITGYKPTIIKYHHQTPSLGGPFYNLLDKMFTLLKFALNREHYAREALKLEGFLGSKKKAK